MSEIKSLGQVAFDAYRAEVVTAFNGDPIPAWDQLDNEAPARRGWEAAAQAIRERTRMMAALDATTPQRQQIAEDFRDRQRSRWQPVRNPAAMPIDYGRNVPGGQGDAPTGVTVPVDVEPDERPVECEDPKCTLDHEGWH